MANPITPRLLTTDQAAAYLSIPAETLTTWRCRGKGPAFMRVNKADLRTGRVPGRNTVRYPIEQLEAWIAANLEGGLAA